jgi:hypothetical protein
LLVLAIHTAGLTAGAVTLAESSTLGVILRVEDDLVLEPPRAEELIDSTTGPHRPLRGLGSAVSDGSGLTIDLPSPATPVAGTVTRSIDTLWTLEIPAGQIAPRIIVHLESLTGAPNSMSCHSDPAVHIPAVVRTTRERQWTDDRGTTFRQGGAVITIPTAGISKPCVFEGRIVIGMENW